MAVYRRIAQSLAVVALLGETSTTAEQRGLPRSIQAQIDVEYPGWRVSSVEPTVAASLRLANASDEVNVIRGDFDGNGRPDYAVLIEYPLSDRQAISGVQVLALFAEHTGYKLLALERPHAHFPNQYVRLIRRGSRGYDLARNMEFRYERDAIGVEFEGEGGHAWVYRLGKFVSIWTSD
jgi:hypothetical protein